MMSLFSLINVPSNNKNDLRHPYYVILDSIVKINDLTYINSTFVFINGP